jgi:uncharacterized membrane protein YphA (DoxX/SURF4 family)
MKSLFFFLVRLAIAALFIYSGVVKALDPAHFMAQMESFNILDYFMIFTIAHVLPMIEIICGILLLTMKYTCSASVILILLSGVFILVLTTLKAMGLEVDCGCFGDWKFLGGYSSHITFDIAIIVFLVAHTVRSAKLQFLLEKE